MLNYTYLYLLKLDLNDQKHTKDTLYLCVFIYLVQETDIKQKERKQSQKQQNQARTGMNVSSQSQRVKKSTKVNPDKVKVNSERRNQDQVRTPKTNPSPIYWAKKPKIN